MWHGQLLAAGGCFVWLVARTHAWPWGMHAGNTFADGLLDAYGKGIA